MSQQVTKEDAPSKHEYRQLKRAAREGVKQDFRLRCEFILLAIGELGLRPGEISHMKRDWVDFDELQFQIPTHQRCHSGKNGDFCGYCKLRARKAAEHNDDLTYELALMERWKPKNPAAVRSIWYGWSEELVDVFDRFFQEYESFPDSRTSINRRIDRITEATPGLKKGDAYPNALRGRAALYHAEKGMNAYHLMEFMGWSNMDAAMEYVDSVASDLKTELQYVHGR